MRWSSRCAPKGPTSRFIQGQYLTFRRDFDGEEIRRTYSICSGLDDGVLQVGIKRVDGGAFSTWANEELAVGDTLRRCRPRAASHPIDPDASAALPRVRGRVGHHPGAVDPDHAFWRGNPRRASRSSTPTAA
jgi:NAD(P)H-flavin reductase